MNRIKSNEGYREIGGAAVFGIASPEIQYLAWKIYRRKQRVFRRIYKKCFSYFENRGSKTLKSGAA